MPESSDAKIEKLSGTLVPKMAECQYQSVSHYPKKYWKKSILPVSKGKSVVETASKFDEILIKDLSKGKISKAEILNMVNLAKERLRKCMDG